MLNVKVFFIFYSFCSVNKYVYFPLLYKGPIDPWTLTDTWVISDAVEADDDVVGQQPTWPWRHRLLDDVQRAVPLSVTQSTHVDEQLLLRPQYAPRVRRLVDAAGVVRRRAVARREHAEDELGDVQAARRTTARPRVQTAGVHRETLGQFALQAGHICRRTWNQRASPSWCLLQ